MTDETGRRGPAADPATGFVLVSIRLLRSVFFVLTAALLPVLPARALTIGNSVAATGGLDSWSAILVVNESDTYTNTSGGPQTVTVDQFHLHGGTFPARTIPAGGFLVVFASAKNRTPVSGNLRTNFSLDAAGEALLLINLTARWRTPSALRNTPTTGGGR